jgi:nucleoside-diphosphate-sugar epimerase
MKYNILITGGAGYIGALLTEKLLNESHKVTVYDNFLFNQPSLNHLCNQENFSVIKGDVRDKSKLVPLLKNYEIILPLAALVGAPMCNLDPVGARTVNHDSIDILLNNISKEQVILMPTTNSAYGTGDENNFCTEESELRPISQYAIDKVDVEKKLMEHQNAVSFRLATVFGMSPRMRIDLLVNDFVYRAIRDGFIVLFESHFKRNYIHIRDVCEVFNFSIKNIDKMKGEIFNVGLSNANLSKKELCDKIKLIIKNFVYFEENLQKDPDQRNYIVSNKKIENLGFKPKVSIEEGIQELEKGYRMLKVKNFSNV